MQKLALLLFLILSQTLTAQNVGIGTTAPVARLHVSDSAVVFTNNTTTFGLFTPPPVQGKGIRMMWYPQKAAFRVGAIDDGPLISESAGSYTTTDWNKDSIGVFSFATGYNTRAKGITSFASGLLNVARGYASTAMGLFNTASGDGSFVLGEESVASGTLSAAIGIQDTASGGGALAMGQGSVASSFNSIAIGYKVRANGSRSTAMGNSISNNGTTGSFAIGDDNTSSTLGNTSSSQMLMRFAGGYRFHITDANVAVAIDMSGRVGIGTVSPNYPLTFNTDLGDKIALWSVSPDNYGFGVQSGLLQIHSDGVLSDIGFGYGNSVSFTESMRIKGNGNVGIGTANPLARLQVTDSSVVFSASGTIPATPGNPAVSGAGRRMMWYSDKAAFRAGYVSNTNWDKDSIGNYSTALGNNNKAKGNSSFAIGNSNSATGDNALAIGNGTKANGLSSIAGGSLTTASGDFAMAMGYGTTASGYISSTTGFLTTASGDFSVATGTSSLASGVNSVSLGENTIASGNASIALGLNSTASGNGSFAAGYQANADATYAIAMGYQAHASGDFSTAFGGTTSASGTGSVSMGVLTTAKAYSSVTIGSYNDNTDSPNPSVADPYDRIFQIGNGNNLLRKNALTVLQNGNIGIGTTSPGFLLSFPNTLGDKISLWGSSGAHYGFGVENSLLQIHTDGIFSDIGFGYGSSGSFTERMRIQGNGNVGIGITAPNAPLAFTNAVGKKICLFESSANSQYGFAVQGAQLQVYSDNPAAKISFGYYMGGVYTERMYLTNNTGVLTVNGTSYPSDARYKKQVAILQHPIEKIKAINGVQYYMRADEFPEKHFDDKLQTGLIAQEVEKVLPQAVQTGSDGYKSVDYARLVPLLVEAIKEQQTQIDELKKLIQQSRKR